MPLPPPLSLPVPVTSVWEKDLSSTGACDDDDDGVEPLNMELKGKKRKLTAAYGECVCAPYS